MKRTPAVAGIVLFFASFSVASGQAPLDISPRAAALRHALASGLMLPSDSIVVARESVWIVNQHHGRLSSMNAAAIANDASELARVAGESVRAGRASDVLMCVRYDCTAKGRNSVLFVTEPEPFEEGFQVMVSAYHPAGRLGQSQRSVQSVVVVVQQRAGGWAAARTRLGPSALHPTRLQPDSLR